MACGDDPAYAYDLWCERQERAYASLIAGMTCRDCGRCLETPDGLSDYGWCLGRGDWAGLGDSVADIDCGRFEL